MSRSAESRHPTEWRYSMAQVLVETSARHVHLTEEHIAILFGEGHTLTKKKDLSQPGQFACEERVTVVGSKKSIANVIVLGLPARQARLRYPSPTQEPLALRLPFVRAVTSPAPALASWLAPAVRLSLPRA